MRGSILAVAVTLALIGTIVESGKEDIFRDGKPADRKAKRISQQYIVNIKRDASEVEVREHLDKTRELFKKFNDDMRGARRRGDLSKCGDSTRSMLPQMQGFHSYVVTCLTQRDLKKLAQENVVKSIEEDTEVYKTMSKIEKAKRRTKYRRKPKCACRRLGICRTTSPPLTTTTSPPTTTPCSADVVSCSPRSVPLNWGLDILDGVSSPGTFTSKGTGTDVYVYVLDTGVRSSHVEFCGRVEAGANFADNSTDTEDRNGHGTHVAGTVAGETVGIAPNATIVPVKVLGDDGSGTIAGAVAGLIWSVEHATNRSRKAVITMSLGCECGPFAIMTDAIVAAVNAGITVVVSAGYNNDACLNSPASVPEAITVAASTESNARASFSSYGPCVDIFAPGVNIRSSFADNDTSYAYYSGTSQSPPHVAGVVAQYIGEAVDYPTPAEVLDFLRRNSLNNSITGSLSENNDLLQAVSCP